MDNIIGIKFMHENQYGSKKTYYFKNNTGFPFERGDKVIVLNYQGEEEVVEVHIPSVHHHPRIPNSQIKTIIGSYPPRNFPARVTADAVSLPSI